MKKILTRPRQASVRRAKPSRSLARHAAPQASEVALLEKLPLYKQVIAELRRRIASGVLGPMDALPSEHQLIAEFGVSRVTVRQALAALEKDGLIFRQQGRGTFVRPARLQHELSRQTTTIVEALRASGIEPEVRILSLEHCELPTGISEALEMQGTQGVKLRRLYSHKGAPIALVTLYVPLSLSGVAHTLARDENAHETIYSIFEQKMGIAIKEARHVIKTVELTRDDAKVLRMQAGSICLLMERLTFSTQGHPLELMTYIYPPGRMSFEMILPRGSSSLLIGRAS